MNKVVSKRIYKGKVSYLLFKVGWFFEGHANMCLGDELWDADRSMIAPCKRPDHVCNMTRTTSAGILMHQPVMVWTKWLGSHVVAGCPIGGYAAAVSRTGLGDQLPCSAVSWQLPSFASDLMS